MAASQAPFSKRFENIVKISRHLTEQGRESVSAKAEAQSIEEQFLNICDTVEDYQKLCDDYVEIHLAISNAAGEGQAGATTPEEIFNHDGPTIGQYEWATFHADGITSTVYKARPVNHDAVEKVVALKVMASDHIQPPHNAERELRALKQLKDDNIIPLLDSFQQPGGKLVLVFPFLRQDLENLLRSNTLTKKQGTMVLKGLFSALSFVHDHEMIHRDIKPSNILLRSMDGPVYLIDFGIVWAANDRDSEPAERKITDVGTTCYRPPELLFGCTNYDSSLDIWAAGCVAAEITRKQHRQLFDAGDLGSELALIKSIFSTLGTPNDEMWPSAQQYQAWGKVRFQDFPTKSWKDLLPGASDTAADFVNKTVCYEPTRRLTARQALEHVLLAS